MVRYELVVHAFVRKTNHSNPLSYTSFKILRSHKSGDAMTSVKGVGNTTVGKSS